MSETRSTVFVHTLTPIASYIPRSISARNSPRIWLSHFSGEPQVSEQRSFKCASGYRHGWRASVPPGRRARGRQRHRAGLHAGHPRRRRLLRRGRPGPQPAGGRHPREGSGRGGGGGVDAAPVGPDADGHGAGADRGDAAAGALQPRAGARGHRGDDADGRVRVVGGFGRGGGGGAGDGFRSSAACRAAAVGVLAGMYKYLSHGTSSPPGADTVDHAGAKLDSKAHEVKNWAQHRLDQARTP
uniref:Uncharacterized protein n=1 Tax=Aegilops tauschii TaxID=37682 RepID=R7WGH9_AEGTA